MRKLGRWSQPKFLRNLIAAVFCTIHTVLSDNGIEFIKQEQHRYALEHIFDRVCGEHAIKHWRIRIKHFKPLFAVAGKTAAVLRFIDRNQPCNLQLPDAFGVRRVLIPII